MIRFAAALSLLAVTALADVPPPRPACTTDSQCVITSFQGCCGSRCSCPLNPYAIDANELKRRRDRCAVVDCVDKRCSSAPRCAQSPPESDFRAVCRGGACEAVPAVANACSENADCAISWSAPVCRPGACGCCPGTTPVAVSRAKGAPVEESRPPPAPPKQGEVKFGLTPGGDAPSCPPCPAPPPASAICSAGRCVVAPPRVRPPG